MTTCQRVKKTQTLNGLRWLEQIEEGGSVTATFDRIIKADDRPAELGKLLREKYAEQIALGEQKASQRQLDESFRPLTGETARKAASFYLPRQRRAKTTTTGLKNGGKAKSGGGGSGSATTLETPTGLHPAVAGLLKDLPREGSGWASDGERDAFLTTFEALVKYAIPVTGEAADDDESSDPDDAWETDE